MKTRLRISIGLLIGCSFLVVMTMFANPSVSTAQLFATNTPRPPDPLAVSPDLPIERYALRLWSAPHLIDVFISLLGKSDNYDELNDAVQLVQYELAWRFPNMPQDTITRQRLFNAMLDAPRGVADMRGVARPLALIALQTGQTDSFHIHEVARLNMDGDGFADIVYQIRYPADDAQPALYLDYFIIRQDANGQLLLAPMPDDIYAAPYQDVLGVDLLATGDYTGDGLDEVLLRVDLEGSNDRLAVYGWRNGQITDLAVEPIEFGDVVSLSNGFLQVLQYEVESEKWGCYRSRTVNWVWASNFFRGVSAATPVYLQLNTIGCQLVAAQPIYEKPPDQALSAIQEILTSHSSDEAGYAQATLIIAILEWLDGNQSDASLRVIGLSNTPNLSANVQRQIGIFQDAIAQNHSPIIACGELTPNGICDIDQLIARLLTENPISRAGDVQAQLELLGLPVQSIVSVSQVGRADRLVATFDITGASQWAFAPLNEQNYVVEKVAMATMNNETPQFSNIPSTAWHALLVNDDGISALNIMDNVIRQNPTLATLPEVQYFRAFCFDVIGNRPNAVNGYYQLWVNAPNSLWGRLAGAHLESR